MHFPIPRVTPLNFDFLWLPPVPSLPGGLRFFPGWFSFPWFSVVDGLWLRDAEVFVQALRKEALRDRLEGPWNGLAVWELALGFGDVHPIRIGGAGQPRQAQTTQDVFLTLEGSNLVISCDVTGV